MLSYIWVMVGGALGTGARFWVSGFVAQRIGEFFPLRHACGQCDGFLHPRLFCSVD